MACRANYPPVENLRSCDKSAQLQSCADGCLAGDVYLDIFASWCLQHEAVCLQEFYTVKVVWHVNTAMA